MQLSIWHQQKYVYNLLNHPVLSLDYNPVGSRQRPAPYDAKEQGDSLVDLLAISLVVSGVYEDGEYKNQRS